MTPAETISVTIPWDSASTCIAVAIRSVLAQCWPMMAVAIVDEVSSTGSGRFVRNAFPQVRVLQQFNSNVVAAIDNGIDHAQGQFLKPAAGARMECTAWQTWPSQPRLEAGHAALARQAGWKALTADRWNVAA